MGLDNYAMAAFGSPAFSSAVAYALSCLGQQDIVLKEKQSEAIKYIYQGKDVFAWLPTGYGKSLCYQLLQYASKKPFQTLAFKRRLNGSVRVLQ